MNKFWRSSDGNPFSPMEFALFFLLLNRAKLYNWCMPFPCSNGIITTAINTTRQNISKARLGLKVRGLIDYTEGINQKNPTMYTLLMDMSQLSPRLTPQFTPYYNINNKKMYTIKELNKKMLEDSKWKDVVIKNINSENIRSPGDLDSFLNEFFNELPAKGVEEREEESLKTYFYNWLKKQLNNNRYVKQGIKNNRFRVAESGSGEKDYEGEF